MCLARFLTKIVFELKRFVVSLCSLGFDNGSTISFLGVELVVLLPFWHPNQVHKDLFHLPYFVLILNTDNNELIKTPFIFLSNIASFQLAETAR